MTPAHELHLEGASGANGASLSEALGGIAAIILTILGLAHVSPSLLAAIATIAIGIALIFQGGEIANGYAALLSRSGELRSGAVDLGGGTAWSMEFLAGAAGIVLGILALLQVVPMVLVAVAAIAFGCALVLSSRSASQINAAKLAALGLDEPTRRVAIGILAGSTGVQAVAGLAAVVLGILALTGLAPMVLTLVALLAIGSFILVNGSALSSSMLAVFHR